MSEENVELTRLWIEAFNRRDLERIIELWDDEGVWYPAIETLTEGRKAYRGRAGWRQYYKDLAGFATDAQAEISELRDLGDQVIDLGRLSMGFTSGVSLENEVACLWTWRKGKCVEARAYLSHADALEAAGQSE